MEKIYTIYKITNLINEKLYIGYTGATTNQRWAKHVYDAKQGHKNLLICKAIRKHGQENFLVEDVYQSKDWNHTLNTMEDHFINLYESRGPKGYNSVKGGGIKSGEGNISHLPEIKQKISDKNSKQWKITYPDEHVEIISNLLQFCKDNNLNSGKMHVIAQGRRVSHKNFKCEDLEPNKRKKSTIQKGDEWLVLFPCGKIEVIKNLDKFCDDNKLDRRSMKRVDKGEYYSHLNYRCKKLGTIQDIEKMKNTLLQPKPRKEREDISYQITHSSGLVEVVKNLPEFCEKHFLIPNSLLYSDKSRTGKHKGYHCKLVRTIPAL